MITLYSPKRFEGANLLDGKPTEAVRRVKSFLSRNNSKNGNIQKCLVLAGPPGTGKTYAIYALMNGGERHRDILQRIYGKDRYGNYRHREVGVITPSFFTMIQYAKPDERTEAIEQAQNLDILCIDDMGMELATERNMALLEMIIDYRYSHLLTTIITTNLPHDAFRERYTERIIDRLREWGIFFEIPGISLRENLDQEFPASEETDWEIIAREIQEERREHKRQAEEAHRRQKKLEKISERLSILSEDEYNELLEKNRSHVSNQHGKSSFFSGEKIIRATLPQFILDNMPELFKETIQS
ncbi:MAG: AAA family ATPase [Candidatus Xenobiia bacterium LiM19]